jgi:hypothetical protein
VRPTSNQQVLYKNTCCETSKLYTEHDGQMAVVMRPDYWPMMNDDAACWRIWFSDGRTMIAYQKELFPLEGVQA